MPPHMLGFTANGKPANWAMDCGVEPVARDRMEAAMYKLALDCTPPGAARQLLPGEVVVSHEWHRRAGHLYLVAVVPLTPSEVEAAKASAERLATGLQRAS